MESIVQFILTPEFFAGIVTGVAFEEVARAFVRNAFGEDGQDNDPA